MKKNMPPATMPAAPKAAPQPARVFAPPAVPVGTLVRDVREIANRPEREQAARHAEHNADVQREYDRRGK